MEGATRVLLVEDSDVYRDTLVFLLSRHEDLEVVGTASTGAAAAQTCAELGADVVVLDYRLPDVDGAEAAELVRETCPGAAVVFLSASAGAEEYDAASRAGAPLVRKDDGIEELVAAIRAASGRSDG